MSHMTADQNKLVKARKGARIAFGFFILGGAVVALYGILTNFLPTTLDGVVLGVASVIPWFVGKKIESKINQVPN